ncbi:MAG: universal stress protein [Candidatus Binatia bacterium]
MFEEVIVCLDGSSLAETILPLARAVTAPTGGKLTLLRVVGDEAELAAEESYLRDCARQYAAQLSFAISADPAGAIATELKKNPHAIAAITTHGRTAWAEAILGGVAFQVIRESHRPVLVYRPITKAGDAPKRIDTVVIALDGNALSEKIITYAVPAARSLRAKLLIVQVLPVQSPAALLPDQGKNDISESAYVHSKAAEIKKQFGLDAQWDVLHGDPAEAIWRYVRGMPNTLLAMTTHALPGIERAILGSVAAACVRHAATPLLLYWPSAIEN